MDMEQPRTWSSQGHGAATDLEQQWTWSSHGPGAATDMDQLQSRRADEYWYKYHMYYIDVQKYFVHKLKNS